MQRGWNGMAALSRPNEVLYQWSVNGGNKLPWVARPHMEIALKTYVSFSLMGDG
jgi:hypothetical protein